METPKQHELMQEREALRAKSKELSAEYDALSKKDEDYTSEEIWRIEKIRKEGPAIDNRLQEIDRKLEMYEVVCDCLDSYNHIAQDVFFREGPPNSEIKSKRILAECYWNDEGFEPYFDILHWYPCEGLKYPEGWYDQGGENVPNNVIKRYAEF